MYLGGLAKGMAGQGVCARGGCLSIGPLGSRAAGVYSAVLLEPRWVQGAMALEPKLPVRSRQGLKEKDMRPNYLS